MFILAFFVNFHSQTSVFRRSKLRFIKTRFMKPSDEQIRIFMYLCLHEIFKKLSHPVVWKWVCCFRKYFTSLCIGHFKKAIYSLTVRSKECRAARWLVQLASAALPRYIHSHFSHLYYHILGGQFWTLVMGFKVLGMTNYGGGGSWNLKKINLGLVHWHPSLLRIFGFSAISTNHSYLSLIFGWTMSEMVKYKGSVFLKRPKSGPAYHHLWHSP